VSDLFDCPFCKYKGSEGWMHLRNKHPDRLDEWREMTDKPKEDLVDEVDQEMTTVPVARHSTTITRRIEFDAGHRIFGHESKCAHIHGHRYVCLLQCAPKEGLDDLGRVIDFGVVKQIVGKWIDDSFDHGMFLFNGDPLVKLWQRFGQKITTPVEVYPISTIVEEAGYQKHVIMDKNPTAENIAELIFINAVELLSEYDIKVVKVTLYETPNCFATYGS